MGTLGGSSSIEIEAPIAVVYAAAANVEATPLWQPEVKVAECIERDSEGNQLLVRMEADAKVRQLRTDLRFTYEASKRMSWTQEAGDLKSMEGSWEFEDLGEGRTRVTYWVDVDLGRVLGMVLRGPLINALSSQLLGKMPERLKRFAESNST